MENSLRVGLHGFAGRHQRISSYSFRRRRGRFVLAQLFRLRKAVNAPDWSGVSSRLPLAAGLDFFQLAEPVSKPELIEAGNQNLHAEVTRFDPPRPAV